MLLESVLVAVTFGLALLLLIVSVLSWRRTGHRRLLGVSIAFGLFLVKAAALLVGLFVPDLWAALSPTAPFLVVDLAIMVALYASITS